MNQTIAKIVSRKKAERERALKRVKAKNPNMIFPRVVSTISEDTKTDQRMSTMRFIQGFWMRKGKCKAAKPSYDEKLKPKYDGKW